MEYDLNSYDEVNALKNSPKLQEYPDYSVAIYTEHSIGMGVVISQQYIATVAHVVDHMKIGDTIKVFQIGDEKQSVDGKLIHISLINDAAVIHIEQEHHFKYPKLCENSFGGQRIFGAKPSDMRNSYRSATTFSGLVTNITKLPLVTKETNKQILVEANIDTRAMSGGNRVVMKVGGPGSAGNSGGAIIDIDNNCVVGLTSMNARISDFEEPEKLMKDVGFSRQYHEGTAPYIMVGIPINYYNEWAK